jgi:predicted ferric reductase
VAHPVFLAIGHGTLWLFGLGTSWPINLGKMAFALMIFAILIVIFFRRLDYLVKSLLHTAAATLVPLLGFVHSILAGSDLSSAGMRIYWTAVLCVPVLTILHRAVVVPFRGRRRFRVSAVSRETHDTWTLALEPEKGARFDYRPGQFLFLTLRRAGHRSEEHPFTMSSSPAGAGPITVTVKESGDFTQEIGQTKVGDIALVEAPFGRFSFVHRDPPALLFIAGGVGITPIMSMLRALRDTADPRPVTLFFANKDEADIIFRSELDQLPPSIRVIHVLSRPNPDWRGPTGRVTAELIRAHAGDLIGQADAYVCGPPAMMNAVTATLRSLGMPRKRIHSEVFGFQLRLGR